MAARTFTLPVLIIVTLAGTAATQTPSLDGLWRSQGYGDVLDIKGQEVRTYEVTNTTCVASGTLTLDPAAAPGREATFRTPGGGVLFVRSGGSADHKIAHSEGSASDVRIDRIPRLPDACARPTENTPAGNFEVFAATWAEHYISFDLKKTDWRAVVDAARPRVTAATTPAELFDILQAMIAPFGDAHTSISAPDIHREFRGVRPGTDRVMKGGLSEFRTKGMPALLGITERAWLKTPLRMFCNDRLQYGHIDQTTGYLRIVSFSGYVPKGDFAAGLSALDAALDDIFKDPALRALVIDVRINFGGDDPYGLAIASRLATRPYLAYTKQARADATDRNKWTPGDPSRIVPSSRPGFRGPVVELTGPLTVSAGETFTQALMGRTPHVTRIGEATQGVFSDVLGRSLPNGWRFGLPNEVFRTPAGRTFDGPGIPPDISVPVFADEDVAAGRDPAMVKAMQILGKKK